jgi:hypothetical protein
LPYNVKPGAIKPASESLLYSPEVVKERKSDADAGFQIDTSIN